MPPALLTIRRIAEALALPESTVRYYRDQFARHIPFSGRGRRRRYPDEAVAILRFVADAYAAGRRREEIEAELNERRDGASVPVAVLPAPLDPDGMAMLHQLATGEAARQEALWQLAQQVAHLGAALERQQVMLGEIVRRLEDGSRALPAPSAPPAAPAEDLAALRRELATERELVERLRRAKLDIERQLVRRERGEA